MPPPPSFSPFAALFGLSHVHREREGGRNVTPAATFAGLVCNLPTMPCDQIWCFRVEHRCRTELEDWNPTQESTVNSRIFSAGHKFGARSGHTTPSLSSLAGRTLRTSVGRRLEMKFPFRLEISFPPFFASRVRQEEEEGRRELAAATGSAGEKMDRDPSTEEVDFQKNVEKI